MDNLCHTLVGLAIGEAGLKRRTPLATATLVIGANLPDVDALAYAWGPVAALGFRRGWTHGVLALAVWPFALAGLMLAWDRLVRRRRRPHAPPVAGGVTLLLAAIALLTHPVLDFLNSYGMRWLMPFNSRWFYGDTLFIVDPYLWGILLAGVLLARRARHRGAAAWWRPARIALAVAAGYVLASGASTVLARRLVGAAFSLDGRPPALLLAGPVPADPVARDVVVQLSAHTYALGSLAWTSRPRLSGLHEIARGDDDLARAAAATPQGRTFLSWSRFPFYRRGPSAECPAEHLCIFDARYYPQAWASVAIPLGGAVSLPPNPQPPEQP